MNTLFNELAEEATTHDEENGWSREIVTGIPELKNPDLLKPFAHAFMSSSSITVKDIKSRRIVGSHVTSGELSRLYLKRVMGHAAETTGKSIFTKRVPYQRDAMQFTDRHPAYYFAGQCGGPFVLVDITACYATLYTRMTLDLTYRPECSPPLLGLGRASFPRVPEWVQAKGPRNALWGNLLRLRGGEWRYGKFIEDAFPNKFFAPDLSGLVYDAAHAIAIEARETFGALSWAVDGGVFRPEEGRRFIEWLEDTFSMIADVRAEGPGWLFGPTSYTIGDVTTQDVKHGRAHEWPETDTLRMTDERSRGWLADVVQGRAA
jgi:hypothetical protein